MDINEVKKILYKNNPTAKIISVRSDGIVYRAYSGDNISITFLVPLSEIGTTVWFNEMDSKLLIRYLYFNIHAS